jgi:hypothetical protein
MAGKPKSKNMLNKKTGLIVLLATITAGELWATTLTSYAIGDVLICFRKSAGGGNDLVVDAGPVSTFTNASPNQRITISQFDGSQLALVGTNSVNWSAFTWFDGTVSPNWTLFATKARSSVNTQTTPPQAGNSGQQQLATTDMTPVPAGAANKRTFKPQNTDTAVVEPDDSSSYTDGQSYSTSVGPNSDFNGDYQGGNVEGTTPGNFTTSGRVVRSDFYRLTPTGGFALGKFLGYFEFNTNGVMTYVAYPISVPVIKSISRSGTTSTINYTTGLYGTYTLRGTNSAGLLTPRNTWPAIATLTSGDTVIHNIPDTTADNNRFYTITAQ